MCSRIDATIEMPIAQSIVQTYRANGERSPVGPPEHDGGVHP